MTRAPTPGPLSVGDRVFAVADLRKHPDGPVWIKQGEEVGIIREYGVGDGIAVVALQDGREGDWAKSCFRLAPTAPVEAAERLFDPMESDYLHDLPMDAPVEASGSEREIVFGQFQPFSDFPDLAAHIGRMGATGQLGSVTEWDTFLATLNAAVSNKEGHIPPINAATVIAYEDAHAVAVEMGYPSLTEALEHLSELRPQPSGETREIARWDICNGGVTEDFEVHADPDGEWVKYDDVATLLSARPLALGGDGDA